LHRGIPLTQCHVSVLSLVVILVLVTPLDFFLLTESSGSVLKAIPFTYSVMFKLADVRFLRFLVGE